MEVNEAAFGFVRFDTFTTEQSKQNKPDKGKSLIKLSSRITFSIKRQLETELMYAKLISGN